MAGLDQLGEMPEKQGQQQHLDMRAVDIGVGQDADLAITQAAQVGAVILAMRVDPQGHRNVVDLVVGKQAVALDLPSVQHLATQRQDCLRFLVPAHLGRTAGRIAFDQEDLVVQDVATLAIGQLAGQYCHTRALAFFDLLRGPLARLRLLDHQLGKLLAMLDMLVQPELEARFHITRYQAQGIAAVQALLGLALELRIQHLG